MDVFPDFFSCHLKYDKKDFNEFNNFSFVVTGIAGNSFY